MIVRLELDVDETDPLAAIRAFVENVRSEWPNYEYDLLDRKSGKTWVVRHGYQMQGEQSRVKRVPDPGGWSVRVSAPEPPK